MATMSGRSPVSAWRMEGMRKDNAGEKKGARRPLFTPSDDSLLFELVTQRPVHEVRARIVVVRVVAQLERVLLVGLRRVGVVHLFAPQRESEGVEFRVRALHVEKGQPARRAQRR